MSHLVDYASESDASTPPSPRASSPPSAHELVLSAAPAVPITASSSLSLLQPDTRQLTVNLPHTALSQPVLGPANPLANTQKLRRADVGTSELYAMNQTEFQQQLRRFHSAQVNATSSIPTKRNALGVEHIDDDVAAHIHALKQSRVAHKRQRRYLGDANVLDGPDAYVGPWADDVVDTDESFADTLLLHEFGEDHDPNLVGDWSIEHESGGPVSSNPKSRLITPGSERSIFHGPVERDYQGRSYLWPPDDLSKSSDPPQAFVPKRCIHTFRGHTKGVNAIRLLPQTGHLILSASMDCKVKLWDVYNDRKVLRTFLGHNKAVRDVCFSNSGHQFLSASFDKYCKLWDTETGQCISQFTSGAVPLCVKFHPDLDKQHVFLAGQHNKKIVQYDVRSGEIVQEYDQHLGPVNSITFVDHNRRFVTTSDDKSLRAWEFDIPVVIKYVAEPHMHSMPAVTLSPNQKWLACQSLDNQILLYAANDKFRLNRKKSYRGHLVAGYGCQVNFSSDGQFIMSGDSTGTMHFWDFKSCKLVKKFKAHDKVVMGCAWLPKETSKVVTCSWDSTIKLWD